MVTRAHRWRCWLAATALTLTSAHAHAVFVVTEPWVRPAGAAQSTEAYMELMSSDGATLVGVRSPVAASVALDGVRGSPPSLSLPAGATVALAPGKYRLTLRKLDSTLRLGDRVPLILIVRGATGVTQEIDVDAEVRLHSPTYDHNLPHTHAKPG
jgi:periplasmic copper chaperone A